MQSFNIRVAPEQTLSRKHFIEHHTKAEDVGSLVDSLSFRLLRRHVADRADHHSRVCLYRDTSRRFSLNADGLPLSELCQTEIQHFHIAVRPQHDVLRFNITMNDAGLMRSR